MLAIEIVIPIFICALSSVIVHHIMIELKVSPLIKSAVVEVTLVSMQDVKTQQKLHLCV